MVTSHCRATYDCQAHQCACHVIAAGSQWVLCSCGDMLQDFGDDPEQRSSDTWHPRCFIGTPLYGAVCVLEGHPHSISSDLESLYYSLRHICCDELPDERTFECPISSREWALTRRGAFTQPQVLPSGPYTEFMLQLHQLFWRKSGYWYDEKKVVTVKDFQDVCKGVAVGV